MEVIHEERHFIVVDKPAGVLSQQDATGDSALSDLVKSYLVDSHPAGPDKSTPYNPFIAPVHRLDRPVSGVSLLARTSKAASRLSRQFRDGTVDKSYLAVTCGHPGPDRQVKLWLLKDRKTNRVEAREHPFDGAQQSVTEVAVVKSHGELSLVSLRPRTGRPHQLRVTLAWLGAAILGDLRYGAPQGLGNWIALHASSLAFDHPISGERCTFEAPLPPQFPIA